MPIRSIVFFFIAVDLLLLLLLLFLGRGASTPFCEACVVNEVQMRREWWNHVKIKQKGERLHAGATNDSKYENYYEKKLLCCFEGDKLYGFSSDFSYQPTMNYTCAHILHTVIQIKSTYARQTARIKTSTIILHKNKNCRLATPITSRLHSADGCTGPQNLSRRG